LYTTTQAILSIYLQPLIVTNLVFKSVNTPLSSTTNCCWNKLTGSSLKDYFAFLKVMFKGLMRITPTSKRLRIPLWWIGYLKLPPNYVLMRGLGDGNPSTHPANKDSWDLDMKDWLKQG
jgi:hypothetical protein